MLGRDKHFAIPGCSRAIQRLQCAGSPVHQLPPAVACGLRRCIELPLSGGERFAVPTDHEHTSVVANARSVRCRDVSPAMRASCLLAGVVVVCCANVVIGAQHMAVEDWSVDRVALWLSNEGFKQVGC